MTNTHTISRRIVAALGIDTTQETTHG